MKTFPALRAAAAVLVLPLAVPSWADSSRFRMPRSLGYSRPMAATRIQNIRTLLSPKLYAVLSAEKFSLPAKSLEIDPQRKPAVTAQASGQDRQRPSDDKSNPLVFAQLAERLFHPGLPIGQHAYVVYPKAQPKTGGVPTEEEMLNEMRRSPLSNPEREKVVIELLMQAGAKREDIILQDAGGGKHNIFVVRKGKSDKIVVIGAHHDKTPTASAGTIDNWTGTTMTANVLQAMMDFETDATVIYALFAREEEGLKGSAYFVRNMPPEMRSRVTAMVNLDTLAVDGTYAWKNNSDESLISLALRVAQAKGLKLVSAILNGGDSDSSSFRRAGIAAMTIFGCSEEMIWKILHSKEDTIKHFSLAHYSNAYNVVLELIKELSGAKQSVPAAG